MSTRLTTDDTERWWQPSWAECRFADAEVLAERYRRALRRAATPSYPVSGVPHAARVSSFLVTAGRIDEDRARDDLYRAAKRAGIPSAKAEELIEKGWSLGREHALAELLRGGRDGVRPGGFEAVAAASPTYDFDHNFSVEPAALDLPVGVLTHLTHDNIRMPVGVGVPIRRDGVVSVRAVLASPIPAEDAWSLGPGDAWTLLERGCLPAVSISARAHEYHTGLDGRLVRATLTAVNLVPAGANEQARVTKVVPFSELSPGARRTQELFNAYLADDANPRGLDFSSRAEAEGPHALDVLAAVTAPLRASSLAGAQ